MSRDPVGYEAGDVNVYRYVVSKPLDFVDPIGLRDIGQDPNPLDFFDIRWFSWRYEWILQGSFGIRQIAREYGILKMGTVANSKCSEERVFYSYQYGHGGYFRFGTFTYDIDYKDEETGWPDPNPGADIRGYREINEWVDEYLRRMFRLYRGFSGGGSYLTVPPCTETTYAVIQLRMKYQAWVNARLYHRPRWGNLCSILTGCGTGSPWVYHGRYSGHRVFSVYTRDIRVVRFDKKLPNCCCSEN